MALMLQRTAPRLKHRWAAIADAIPITNMHYSTSRNKIITMLVTQANIIAQPPGSSFHGKPNHEWPSEWHDDGCFHGSRKARLLATQFSTHAAANREPKLADRPVEIHLFHPDGWAFRHSVRQPRSCQPQSQLPPPALEYSYTLKSS
jgi:hypothetical protein